MRGGSGWRGRGRGGGGGRGRGGWGRGGHRNSRHRDDSGTTGAGSINWDIGEDETAASNRGSAQKPQHPARGGGRQGNTVSNNDTANTVSTENASAPDTAEQ